jgi:glycosyltransferase involved in cell wall biosynthesis
MRNLILLTTSFPYGRYQEAFLETEIIYLASEFDRVYIIATKPESSFKRSVPENAEIIEFPNNNVIFRSLSVIRNHGITLLKYAYSELPHIIKKPYEQIFKKLLELLKHLMKGFMIAEYLSDRLVSGEHKYVVYSYWFNSAALAAGLLKKMHSRVKAISRVHGWDLYYESHAINYIPLQRLKASLLDKCFFISAQGKDYFENNFLKGRAFIVSRLGTLKDTANVTYSKNNTFNIVSCSFLLKGKRIDNIIESLSLIDEIKIRWTHLGGGELSDELNTLASARLGNKNNISYRITGDLTNREVLEFYRNNYVHLFINTSRNEGLPVSIMEAMSFGIPVIATDAGGTSEIVNKTCGILLKNDCSFDEIRSAILKIRSEYNDFPYRTNAYNNWLNNFNADVNYKNFADQISAMI